MCSICIMLDDSFPGPKNLVRAIFELNPTAEHTEVILNKAMDELSEEGQLDLATEMMLEALRVS